MSTVPDLSYLSTTEVRKSTLSPSTRGRAAGPNPMLDHLKASIADNVVTTRDYRNHEGDMARTWDGEPRELDAKAGHAMYIDRLLRSAADHLGCGVTVQVKDAKTGDLIRRNALPGTPDVDGIQKVAPNKNVVIVFAGKQRTERAPRANGEDEQGEPNFDGSKVNSVA